MRKYYFIFLTLVFALFLEACAAKNREAGDNNLPTTEAIQHKRFEIPGIQVIPIRDTRSDRLYELYVKLPAGYSESNDI